MDGLKLRDALLHLLEVICEDSSEYWNSLSEIHGRRQNVFKTFLDYPMSGERKDFQTYSEFKCYIFLCYFSEFIFNILRSITR